jgi:hypothetical protein
MPKKNILLFSKNVFHVFCVTFEESKAFASIWILSTCDDRQYKWVISKWLKYKPKLIRISQKNNSFNSPLNKIFFEVCWDGTLFSRL